MVGDNGSSGKDHRHEFSGGSFNQQICARAATREFAQTAPRETISTRLAMACSLVQLFEIAPS